LSRIVNVRARIDGQLDARAVVGIPLLDTAADAGIVGVLQQFADGHLAAGVEVFCQDFEQSGQV